MSDRIVVSVPHLLEKKSSFVLTLFILFTIGTFLRLQGLPSQLLLDDEWHNLVRVIGSNLEDLLTQFNPHDNSNPTLALYDLALYRFHGWSEFTIRLPVVAAGIISLFVLPLLIRKIFGDRIALIFAAFLAISPFLIFYSRYARGYGLVMFLCFVGILFFYFWLTEGRMLSLVLCMLAGVLAVYTHPSALIAVLTPFVVACTYESLSLACNGVTSDQHAIIVPLKKIVIAGTILALLLLPLMIPLILKSPELPWREGSFAWGGVVTAVGLFSGTAFWPPALLLCFFCLFGQVLLFRKNRILAWLFLSLFLAYVVILAASGPLGLDIGAVALRYMIVLVPVGLTLVAISLEHFLSVLHDAKRAYRVAAIALLVMFIGGLFLAGPLPAQLNDQSNFTDHSAFQGSYAPLSWSQSRINGVYPGLSIKENQIPPVYHLLACMPDIKTVLEYPFDVCDYNDLFYYYQHFHGKRVLAGYCADTAVIGYVIPPLTDQPNTTVTIGMLSLDDILSRVSDPTRVRFRNLVDVTDSVSLVGSRTDAIILHKYLVALKIENSHPNSLPTYGSIRVDYRSVRFLAGRLKETLGRPLYEDEQIVCFKLKK